LGALLLACFVACLIGFPSFYFRYFSGEYKGVDFFKSDGDWAYLSQVQEINDGHYSFGNLYGAENKDNPSFAQQTLGPIILDAPTKLLPVTPADTVLFSKFIIGFVFTWLVYLFFFVLLGRKRLDALVATSFTVFIPATTALLDPTQWRSVLLGFSTSKLNFLALERTINPQFGSLAVYAFFGSLWKCIWDESSKNRRWWGAAAGIALGLSFYTYFFAYSFIALFSVFLLIWFACRKQWQQALRMVYVGGIALVVAIPFFWNFYVATHSAFYQSVVGRLGGVVDHTFVFSRIILLAAVVWILFRKKFVSSAQVFFGIFLLTAFFVTEQQVLTGHVIPQYSHYHWYYVAPMLGAFLCLVLLRVARGFPRRMYIGTAVMMFVLFSWSAVLFQWRSYEAQLPSVLSDQRYSGVLSWLNRETPKDSVVLANENLSELTVAYTHDNVYTISNFADSLISVDRLQHAVFALAYLEGARSDTAAAWFQENRDLVGADLFGQYYRQVDGGCYGCFPQSMMDDIVKRYQEYASQDFITRLTDYQLDYIVWDSNVDPSWTIDPRLTDVVYEDDGLKVFNVHP
jgi:hypothetical protein